MRIKKSLDEALFLAVQYSKTFPDKTVWVLERPYSGAILCTSNEGFVLHIRSGYHCYARVIGGKIYES